MNLPESVSQKKFYKVEKERMCLDSPYEVRNHTDN